MGAVISRRSSRAAPRGAIVSARAADTAQPWISLARRSMVWIGNAAPLARARSASSSGSTPLRATISPSTTYCSLPNRCDVAPCSAASTSRAAGVTPVPGAPDMQVVSEAQAPTQLRRVDEIRVQLDEHGARRSRCAVDPLAFGIVFGLLFVFVRDETLALQDRSDRVGGVRTHENVDIAERPQLDAAIGVLGEIDAFDDDRGEARKACPQGPRHRRDLHRRRDDLAALHADPIGQGAGHRRHIPARQKGTGIVAQQLEQVGKDRQMNVMSHRFMKKRIDGPLIIDRQRSRRPVRVEAGGVGQPRQPTVDRPAHAGLRPAAESCGEPRPHAVRA